MKLKKIESKIKKTKTIFFESGWIGTEKAVYPVYNLKNLSVDNIFAMFDISEEKRDDISQIVPELFACADVQDKLVTDEEVSTVSMDLVSGGKVIRPLCYGEGRVLFIDPSLLAPVLDQENGIVLAVRYRKDGAPYICVFSGMLLVGLIEPEDIDTEAVGNILSAIVQRIRWSDEM